MWRKTGVAVLVVTCLLALVNGVLEPPSGTRTFVRSSVESLPSLEETAFAKYSQRPTIEEVFSLTRSALESAPTIDESIFEPEIKFNRAAVEYRLAPGFETFGLKSDINELEISSEESGSREIYVEQPKETSTSERLQVSTIKDSNFPHPFRAGSPFQEILSSDTVLKDEVLEKYSLYPKPTETENQFLRIRTGSVRRSSPKVLCYFTNWATYRVGDGKFAPEHIDTNLCSAIIYSFASLDPETLLMREFDPWVDLEHNLYRRTTALDVPVLIALGGWTDSTGDKYSRLVSSSSARQKFVSNAISFIRQYGFSGLHLDWNYPKCWQSDCSKGPASDKTNLSKLIEELRRAFDRVDPSMQLGVAISGYKEVIMEAYDLSSLSRNVDYLTAMTYDYHGAWEEETGHVSPLYMRQGDKYPHYNSDSTIQLLIKNGAAKEKLIMGIPFYGQTFKLKQNSRSLLGEGTPSMGAGDAGEFTRQPGMMSYYEVCTRIRKHKWMVGRDEQKKSGPFAMRENQWVGYEDPASVEAKARYVLNMGLGGVAAWTIDLDDFLNRCCSESFGLLKSINRALGRLETMPPRGTDCTRPPEPVTPVPPVMTTVGENGIPGPAHEHTTWPSWNPSTQQVSTTTEHYHPTKPNTTPKPTTWWPQTTTSTTESQPVTWWPQTTARPTTTTTRRTTTPTKTTTTTTTTTRRPTRPPTMATTTTEMPTTIPASAVMVPVFIDQPEKCEFDKFREDPKNCNAFYQCVYGEMTQRFCPGGLHWNRQTMACDWPANAKCTEMQSDESSLPITTQRPTTTTRTTTPRTTTRITRRTSQRTTQPTTTPYVTRSTSRPTVAKKTTTPRPIQILSSTALPSYECESGEYYPHAECDSFYVCVFNKLVPQQCGPGLYWNSEGSYCDLAENVRCLSVRKYLRLVDFRVSADDPCNGATHVPYPGDCSQYLQCLHNRLTPFSCADGLHWNQNVMTCDWPANAHCSVSTDDNIIPVDNGDADTGSMVPQSTKPPTTTTTTTPRPTYPTDKPDLEPLSGYYKVVCYFTNWAWYRKGLGKYTPDHINTDLCTHIVYGFAVLDYSELTIRTHDSWADIDNNFYTRVSGLKEKGVKVTLALGGWNDSKGDKYSRLVRNPASRAKFVRQSIQFIEKYGFEGLDLDWEYPVCWQTDCKKGFADEKEGFTALVRELSEAYKPRNLLLSTAVSPSKKIIDAGYDVPQLSKYFDWIAVMTYDFHGQWDKKTGHVAPLYYHPDDDISYFNANFSLHYWMEKGAPSRKLVMGMPLYGQSFTLSDVQKNTLNSHAPGPGQAGEFTRAAGFLAYYEICDRIKTKDWQVVHDERGRMGPYAYKGSQWVSFDDKEMIRRKSQLVRALNLGGGMVWALDLDDFRNRCGEGVHPLLTTLRNVLKDPPSGHEMIDEATYNPDQPGTGQEMEEEQEMSSGEMMETSSEAEIIENPDLTENGHSTQPTPSADPTDEFKVVCYFTNWAWYRQSGGKFLPEDIDHDLCTHIVYGFAVLDRGTLTIKPHDSWADIDNRFYERIVAFRAKGIKVTVAIGGWNDSAGDKYSRLVKDPASRARFVKHVIQFIEKYGFDGLDLDWEYPVCWQVDCTKGQADEKEGFTELVRELSVAFKPRNLLLSSAVSPNKKVIDAGYNVPELSNLFDWIAVMTYDFHGQWDKKTGHIAPMYKHPMDDTDFNANYTIHYWIEKGADRKKLVMGMPMYGQSFSLADNSRNTLNSPTYGGGEAGDATRARGFLSYYEICQRILNRGWKVVRDRRGRMGPYAYSRDQWVSFDDSRMIRHKSEYVKAMELGGAMIWALDLDDFRNQCNCETYPLLKTINRVLRNYQSPDPKCKLEDRAEVASENFDFNKPVQPTPWTAEASPSTAQKSTTGRPTTTTTTTTRRTTTTSRPVDASDSVSLSCDGRNFARHKDCNKYYICMHGQLAEQRCPDGLHWAGDRCDWPQNSGCVNADEEQPEMAPTTPKPSTRPTTRPTPRPTTAKPELEMTTPTYSSTKKPIVTTTKKPSATKPTTLPGNSKYKVVCYFTNWAWYRPGEGKYTPDDIDPNLCTHIIYGFAVLNGDSLTIRTHDSWADIDNRFYERVTELKEKGIRVLLAIGGWNDSAGDKYSRLVLNSEARRRFIKHVIEFLEKHNFEGLDLDWEYPVCWQVDCKKGQSEEKEGFASLVRELSEEFKPRGLLLSAAVSPSKKVIDAGYDVPTLAKYFDWISVMTYDFHGNWDKQTGHISPMYYVPGDMYEAFNSNFSINYWIEKGAPPEKIIMGMPLYGQSFSLVDSNNRGLNAKASGPGEAGRYTRARGFLAYYEICERVNLAGWTVERDSQGRIGPFAYKGNQWVSYDDVSEIRRKSNFIKKLRLGGGMIWALDLDDFRGRCGCGRHPLLRTLTQELRGLPGQRATDCT